MKTEIITITPAMAREMLSFNKTNRKLRKLRVLQYAHDMKNGKWNLTGQGITFGTDGRLLDGQHRLYAITVSNVSVPMLVIRDAEVVGTYDCGLPRNTVDQFKLMSEMNTGGIYTTNGMAAIKLCYQIAMNGTVSRTNKPTTADLKEYIDKHHSELVWMTGLNYIGRQQGAGGSSSGLRRAIIEATLYSIHKLDIGFTKMQAERFARVLRSGLSEARTDAPIIALRNRLMSLAGGSTDAINKECFLRIQYAVSKYLGGSTSLRTYLPDKNIYNFTPLKGEHYGTI